MTSLSHKKELILRSIVTNVLNLQYYMQFNILNPNHCRAWGLLTKKDIKELSTVNDYIKEAYSDKINIHIYDDTTEFTYMDITIEDGIDYDIVIGTLRMNNKLERNIPSLLID